jgi:hypothetical protein
VGKITRRMRKELQLLFYTICDGLRQEVRQRSLTHLATGQDFSIVGEREIGLASLLALHLRSVGFMVQLDAYFYGNPKLRPDFGIWLPASEEYIYLELKQTAWGTGYQYSYQGAINDIEKLNRQTNSLDQRNGLIAVGFSKPEERTDQLLKGFRGLSERITRDFPHYEEIGLECVDFQEMDIKSSHAVVGLWFRKEWEEN